MSFLQKLWGGASNKDEATVPELEHSNSPYCELQILDKHTEIVSHLVLADADTLISASDDAVVCVWDVHTGCLRRELRRHPRKITNMLCLEPRDDHAIVVSPQQQQAGRPRLMLVTVGVDKLMCVWNVRSGECLHEIRCSTAVRCLVQVSREVVCAAGERVSLWNVESGEQLQDELGSGRPEVNALYDDDIQYVIVAVPMLVCAVRDRLLFFELHLSLHTGSYKLTPYQQKRAAAAAMHQHRDAICSLVNVSDKRFASGSLDGEIKLWSLNDISSVDTLHAVPTAEADHHNGISAADHPAGTKTPNCRRSVRCMFHWYRYLFAAVGAGYRVYDTEAVHNRGAATCVAARDHCHHSQILDMVFLDYSAILVTCAEDGSIRLWGGGGSHSGGRGGSFGTAPSRRASADTYPATPHNVALKFLGRHDGKHATAATSAGGSHSQGAVQPRLLGECLAHTDGVKRLATLPTGFASCSMDHLVMMWKHEDLQAEYRTRFIRDHIDTNSG